MAKLTSPCYSEEAHGRAGAVVYRDYRGTAIASVQPAVHKRHTPLVQRTMARSAAPRRRWRTMSSADRKVWNRLAREYGKSYQYGCKPGWTGFNWWMHLLLVADYVGAYHIGKPPAEPLASHMVALEPTQSGAAIYVDYSYYLGPTIWTHWLEIRMMGPHSPGKTPRLKDTKRVGSWLLGFSPYILVDEQPGLYTLFARTVDSQGLTSPHIHASVTMEF